MPQLKHIYSLFIKKKGRETIGDQWSSIASINRVKRGGMIFFSFLSSFSYNLPNNFIIIIVIVIVTDYRSIKKSAYKYSIYVPGH